MSTSEEFYKHFHDFTWDFTPDQIAQRTHFCIEMEMRIDLYDILNKVREKEKNLPNEQERYLDKILLYKKRNGLHLPKEKRDELEIILKEIMNLCIDFNRNLSEEDVKLKFKKSDLLGMREDFIENLSKDGDDLIVTLKYPHVVPILKQCSVVKTRQIIEKAYNSRCIDSNVKILEKLIKLRHKRAHILGYSTHADFITEILMSKNGLTVRNFLEDLALKLRDSAKIEMSRLLELKKEDCLNFEIPFDCKINPYDFSYYQRIVEEKDFMVNQNVIKEYFPFEYVTEKLLELYQSLLSVRFAKVEGTKTWHPEVTLYAVFDEESQELLGYFYLDLFPREGKYTHAACFGIQSASATKFGNQVGCAAMVANFTKPSPDKPSLLTHDEVETYFHEFGHVMHHICSRTHYCLFQ
ncbi:hypothetical protein HZS_1582 [Henneguya salminicola]|nr:hypothetical protein HZS_1582 [Henneguya salminicola]